MHLHFSSVLRPPCPPNIPRYTRKGPDKSVPFSALGCISPFWFQFSCTLLFAPSCQMHFSSLLTGIWLTNLPVKKGRKVPWGLTTCLCLLMGWKRGISTVTSSSSCIYVVSVLFCLPLPQIRALPPATRTGAKGYMTKFVEKTWQLGAGHLR